MGALKSLNVTPAGLAGITGVSLATVYRWRNGETSPTARQVYKICAGLNLRPGTFTSVTTQHAHVYRMPYGKPGASAVLIGEWVRTRMQRSRLAAEHWPSIRFMAKRCRLDWRTVRKCLKSDDVRWSDLCWFLGHGLAVEPCTLMNPDQKPPIPQFDGTLTEYAKHVSFLFARNQAKKPSKHKG
jgi:hypothetical protein